MNEVIEKTYDLIDELDNSIIIKELLLYKKEITHNKEIQELLSRGNNLEDDYALKSIKEKLYSYREYKKYMENYTKLRYITMDINNKINSLINNKSCHRI